MFWETSINIKKNFFDSFTLVHTRLHSSSDSSVFLEQINKYKIFGFKIKVSVKEYVIWPKDIILFNTSNLEQFSPMFEIIK